MMNLLYIFDNYTFNNSNNYVINTLKRWIIYNFMIYSKDDNYDKITLIKTGPDILKCTINLKKDNVILKTLEIINSIIYKKYDTYPVINFMLLAETLDEYNDFDTKIVIFTSMADTVFTQTNKDYINNVFEKFKEKINIVNISKYKYLYLHFKNINEYYIDHRNKKINNIIHNDIFELETYDESFFDNSDYLVLDNNTFVINKFVINSLTKLYNIELYILSTEVNLEFHDKIFLIVNTICIEIDKYIISNVTINNIFKNYINQIKTNLITKHNICSITVPINELDTQLSTSTIKYILEFYEEIYPKIINYYIESNIKNYKIPVITTRKIIKEELQKIQQINPILFQDKSKEFLVSNTTMTNWIDEYNDFNPFGILVKYNISKFAFKGLIDENSNIYNTYPNMIISSVANNWISIFDYYQMILAELNNTNDMDDNIMDKNKLELNKFIIVDKLNGDTNIMLPIYINKKHWELSKILWSYHIAFINNTFEFNYNKKMDNVYYFVLLKSFNNLSDNNKLNNNFIRTFIYILRTCIQISLDNYYITNINNETNKYFNYFNNLNSQENRLEYFNRFFIDYLIRLLQLIVSSTSDISQVKIQLASIRNFIISEYIYSNYTTEFWNNLIGFNEEKRKIEINVMKTECIQNNKSYFDLEIDLIALCEFINNLYKIKNFNQFYKNIDKFNGCIPTNGDNLITCEGVIKTYNDISSPKIFNIDNIENIENFNIDIEKFINEYKNGKFLNNKSSDEVDEVDKVDEVNEVDNTD
jgi:hypothetical protein